jgi:hypothetical protein
MPWIKSVQAKKFPDEQNHFLHIPFKNLSIEEKPIGTGGFADVYKGLWLTHQDEVAFISQIFELIFIKKYLRCIESGMNMLPHY